MTRQLTLTRNGAPVVSPEPAPVAGDISQYPNLALAAWVDAQLNACELADLIDRIEATEERITKGDAWFASHDRSDPDYGRARRLWSRLVSESDVLRAQAEREYVLAWAACCVAASYAREAGNAGLSTPEMEELDVNSGEALWPALETGLPPRAWPLSLADYNPGSKSPHALAFKRERRSE